MTILEIYQEYQENPQKWMQKHLAYTEKEIMLTLMKLAQQQIHKGNFAVKRNIQFIQITPEELQEGITKEIKKQFETLQKDFQPKEPTEYMTRNEVAELLKVDLSTVWNWTKKGKLIAYGLETRVNYLNIYH